MPRRNSNGRGLKHDIRLNFRELANRANLTPRQKLEVSRYMKEKLQNIINRGGEHT